MRVLEHPELIIRPGGADTHSGLATANMPQLLTGLAGLPRLRWS